MEEVDQRERLVLHQALHGSSSTSRSAPAPCPPWPDQPPGTSLQHGTRCAPAMPGPRPPPAPPAIYGSGGMAPDDLTPLAPPAAPPDPLPPPDPASRAKPRYHRLRLSTLLGTIGVLIVASNIGTILSATLVNDHPVALIAPLGPHPPPAPGGGGGHRPAPLLPGRLRPAHGPRGRLLPPRPLVRRRRAALAGDAGRRAAADDPVGREGLRAGEGADRDPHAGQQPRVPPGRRVEDAAAHVRRCSPRSASSGASWCSGSSARRSRSRSASCSTGSSATSGGSSARSSLLTFGPELPAGLGQLPPRDGPQGDDRPSDLAGDALASTPWTGVWPW